MTTKEERANQVNEVVKAISSCGRRFFYYSKEDRVAKIEVAPNGHIWWTDEYTGKRIYTHQKGRWSGFSGGGTLKWLVEAFRDYVSKNKPVDPYHFGPWADHICDGDLWGYGDDMKIIRNAAINAGLIET